MTSKNALYNQKNYLKFQKSTNVEAHFIHLSAELQVHNETIPPQTS